MIFQNTAENVTCRFIWPFSIHMQFGLAQNLGLNAAITHFQKPQGKPQPGSRANWQKFVKSYAFS